MERLLEDVSEKLRERKKEFFVCVLLGTLISFFNIFFQLNFYLKFNSLVLTVIGMFLVSFLPIFFMGKLVFKEKIRDLLNIKVVLNIVLIILITILRSYSPKILYLENISSIIGILNSCFLFSTILAIKSREKSFIPLIEIFRYFYRKKNLVFFIFLVWLYEKLYFIGNYKKLGEALAIIFSVVITNLIILVVYMMIEKDFENKVSEFLKGKFAKLCLKIYGIVFLVAMVVIFLFTKMMDNGLSYFEMGVIFFIYLFTFYFIKEFEIKSFLKIYDVNSYGELIYNENIKSFFKIILKIVGLNIAIVIMMKLFMSVFYSETIWSLIISIIEFIMLYLIYYELDVEFVKNRLKDLNLNYYKPLKNKSILILGGMMMYIVIYESINLFPSFFKINLVNIVIFIVGALYLESNLVYFILKKNKKI